MKIEELRNLQPSVFQRFVTILEQRRLAHAYLFSCDFASFDMAIFLSQSLFCRERRRPSLSEVSVLSSN